MTSAQQDPVVQHRKALVQMLVTLGATKRICSGMNNDDALVGQTAAALMASLLQKRGLEWATVEREQRIRAIAFAYVVCEAWAWAIRTSRPLACVHAGISILEELPPDSQLLPDIRDSINFSSAMYQANRRLLVFIGGAALRLLQQSDAQDTIVIELECCLEQYWDA